MKSGNKKKSLQFILQGTLMSVKVVKTFHSNLNNAGGAGEKVKDHLSH